MSHRNNQPDAPEYKNGKPVYPDGRPMSSIEDEAKPLEYKDNFTFVGLEFPKLFSRVVFGLTLVGCAIVGIVVWLVSMIM